MVSEWGKKTLGPEPKGVGIGKEYEVPEYFDNDTFSFYDMEKKLVDSKKRLDQPESGLSEYW